MQAALVVIVVAAEEQGFAAHYDVVFTVHPASQVSLHDASTNYYSHVLSTHAPAEKPHNIPEAFLLKLHESRVVNVLYVEQASAVEQLAPDK